MTNYSLIPDNIKRYMKQIFCKSNRNENFNGICQRDNITYIYDYPQILIRKCKC